ncbi:RNA polymerase sigma factor [Oceanobacillus kimchii]|uniref:RNA polymerase sigma factor n=1 Tax=Oceanobacillus kimchii TaxID=746691 RepID=UPI00295EBA02|nr:sigma-70 family RNA polymerase sigma factor [Oceanobacillus kimchii]
MARLHLIARLKQREEDALTEVMNTYGNYLLRTAFLLVKDHQMAEEAVQDTYITAFEKIHQLEDAAKLKSWLTTILINRCRSHMRKSSWKNLLPAIDFDLFQVFKEDTSAGNPEDFLLHWEGNQQLSYAIQQLDYKYREVITLFYYNEMKITEIALHTNANENTVKSKLKRARLLLKDILLKGEESHEASTPNHKTTAR